MTIFRHELRLGRTSFLIWTAAISTMLAACILIYPDMAGQVGQVNDLFANMGSFSQAFGMDQLNFGEFIGFFGVECGNVLGIGGGLYAALLGISALAREEQGHTADFLFTAPISRGQVIAEKLLAVAAQLILLNLVTAAVTAVSIFWIGENVDWKLLALLLLANFLMQLEIAAITFGLSSLIKRGGLGLGLGLAMGFYFLNLIANLTEQGEFLKYLTPFGYTDSASILTNGALELPYLAAGAALCLLGILLAFGHYTRKDLT